MKDIHDDQLARPRSFACPECGSDRVSKQYLKDTGGRTRLRATCLDCSNSDTFLYSVGGSVIGHTWETSQKA